MTLINDDKIEEFRFEKLLEPSYCLLFIGLIPFFIRKLLIEREINFMRSDGSGIILCIVDLMYGLLQWREILLYGLINKDVPVCKI